MTETLNIGINILVIVSNKLKYNKSIDDQNKFRLHLNMIKILHSVGNLRCPKFLFFL